ncbi:hypothetical protein [Pseudolysinimonas sp.]
MARYTASLRIDMGPQASFGALSAAVADLENIVGFASRVQARIDRNDAAYSALRRRDFGPIFDDFDIAPGFVRRELLAALLSSDLAFRSPSFERLVEERLAALADDRTVRVVRLLYLNPLDLNISFGGDGLARILEVIRDWTPARREAAARARQAEAAADEAEADARAAEVRAGIYEDERAFRKGLQDDLRRRLASGDLRLSGEDVQGLLTAEIQRSLEAVAKADVVIDLAVEDAVEDIADEEGLAE